MEFAANGLVYWQRFPLYSIGQEHESFPKFWLHPDPPFWHGLGKQSSPEQVVPAKPGRHSQVNES